MREIIRELISSEILKTESIIDAFQRIDRADFVTDEERDHAYVNAPLSIGYGQTISQPLTVAFMLELLEPEKGNKILEIGSGSGWQTSLLSHIVGSDGKVFALELIPELEQFGRKNTAKYNFIKNGIAEFHCLNAVKGLPDKAPFDKIISAASAKEVPQAWKEQLKIGGRMVLPIENNIVLFEKKGEDDFIIKKYPGFTFVPFVDK
jgi:protein-L-isoaspartate(D-aspartate) O-methyltransferase